MTTSNAINNTLTKLSITNTTNQLVLGTTNTITLNSTAPAASRVYTLPDAGAAANIVLTTSALSNGGILYSTATTFSLLSGTATARQMLQSGSSTTPAWSTATWPATTTANQLLYSSSTNTVGGLSTSASGVLSTDGSGVPSISTNLPGGLSVSGSGAFSTVNDNILDDGTGLSNLINLTINNSITNSAANVFGNTIYSTGTIAQSGTTITGTGTTFTAAMVGGILKYTSGGLIGTYVFITGFTDATHITVNISTTEAGPDTYTITYGGLSTLSGNIGLNSNIYGDATWLGTINLNISGSKAINIGTGSYSGTITLGNGSANVKVAGNFSPVSAGGTNVGTTTIPFGQAVLGSSSSNYIVINPASVSAARNYTMPDVGQDASFVLNSTSEIVGTSQTIIRSSTYVANNASLVTFTLPTTASQGDMFMIIGKGAGLFKIAQNASQVINFGTQPTTTGAGGSITALNQYCTITVMCITANNVWVVRNHEGNFTVT